MKYDNPYWHRKNYINNLTEPTLIYQKSILDMQSQTAATMKLIQEPSNIADVISGMQIASQFKLPGLSNAITASAIQKTVINQAIQAFDLSAFTPQIPNKKLISSLLKSAALANRLSFSSLVLSKGILGQTVKIPAADWKHQQNKGRNDSNFESTANGQTNYSNAQNLGNEVENHTERVNSEIAKQENIGENQKSLSHIMINHKLPPLMDMLNIAQYILLTMQIFRFDDKYIQLAYIAITSFIVKSYFNSSK